MRRRTVRWLLFLLCAAVLGLPLLADEERPSELAAADTNDPLPLRRVPLPPNRLAGEMERVKRGLLRQLPRGEFEERVARAARALAALQQPPRLIEARYRAVLTDSALEGTAEWKIVHQGPPGLMPLSSLNLALRQARWSDNKELILGDLDGGLGLLVEQAGEHSASLEWTASGNPLPGDLHFDLRLPACALASLEVDLPSDRVVVVPRDTCLLSGPHAGAVPERSVWRIGFAGQSQVDLSIRPAQGQGHSLLLARLQSRMELAPGQVQADYEFDLEVLHQGVDRFVCECDPSLRPYEVGIRNLEKWQLRPGPNPAAPSQLEIRLSEPLQAESRQALKIRCVAPLPSDRVWICPRLQLAGAVPRGETIALHIDPEVQIEDWQSGGFRLSEALAPSSFLTPRPSRSDSGPDLTLTAGLEAGPNPKRPSARIKTQGADYRVRQLSWWQVSLERPTLTANLSYKVVRGRLFQLPLLLPPGWEVDRVELTPRDLLRTSAVLQEQGRRTLMIDLQRGLVPAQPATQLQVRLRPAGPRPTNSRLALPIPDVTPLGPRLQEGALAVSVDPLYQATVAASVPAENPEPTGATADNRPAPRSPRALPVAPWGQQTPDHYFPFRREAPDGGFRAQAVQGKLQLQPRPARVRARCETEVLLAGARLAVITRLELNPEAGAVETLDLLTSLPFEQTWHWKTLAGDNQVKRVQRLYFADAGARLAVLGANHPLAAATFLAAQPARAVWWRLTLARPLRERLELEAFTELPGYGADPICRLAALAGSSPLEGVTLTAAAVAVERAANERHWEVPLVLVPAAESLDGTVTVYLARESQVQAQPTGLVEEAQRSRGDSGAAARRPPLPAPESVRSFRYKDWSVGLTLLGRTLAGEPPAEPTDPAVADQAQLTVYVEPTGTLRNHFRFQVSNWRQRTLPLRLPVGARVVEARPDLLSTGSSTVGEVPETTVVFDVPVATSHAPQCFEIVYELVRPAPARWSLGTRLDAPAPVLPVRTLAFRRTWYLPPEFTPLAPERLQRLPGPGAAHGGLRAGKNGAGWHWLGFTSGADWADHQRQVFTEAVERVRKQQRPGEDGRLGQILERLALEMLSEQPLVLDGSALAEGGLNPATLLNPPSRPGNGKTADPPGFLFDAELIYIPCQAAAFLTTRHQAALWQLTDSAGVTDPCSESVTVALREATAHGHDRSGRFRTVADWLQHETAVAASAGARTAAPRRLVPAGFDADWTAWEPLAGTEPDTLVVVRQDILPVPGLVLAAVLLLVAIRLRHLSRRWGGILLIGWLAVGGLALLWLPSPLHGLALWPLLAGMAVALALLLRGAVRGVPAPAPPRPSGTRPVAAGMLALTFAVGLAGQAAAPTPVTVYLVPGPAGAADRESVLAPPALLEDLDALAQRGAAGLEGAMLLRANYEGRIVNTNAHFEAIFQIHNFAADDTTAQLTLPLAGVKLQEALLDGAAAFPRTLRGPREGFTVDVKGRGSHTLVVRFLAEVAGTPEERDLRCTIPELLQSRMVLDVPTGTRYLTTVGARGAQRISRDPRKLKVDLGRINTLHVRWRQEGEAPRGAVVRVEEAYFWELAVSSARLLALLQYHVRQGAVTTLAIGLPPQVEVRSVEAEASPARGGTAAPRLKEWLLTEPGPNRRLQLEFQGPVSGDVQVRLELVPRQPFGSTARLPFLVPLDNQATRGALPYRVEPARSFLAYRLDGLETTSPKGSAIKRIPDEDLKKMFTQVFADPWRAGRRETLEFPTGAFQSTPGGSPVLELALRAPASQASCRQDVAWQVGPRQADLRATARWSNLDAGQVLLEWEVPVGVVVATVSGTDVRSWSRKDARIQVWLQQAVGKTTIQLTGWQPRAQNSGRFDVPGLRLLPGTRQTTHLRVTPAEGLALLPERLQHLQPLYDVLTGEETVYVSEQPNYAASFRVRSAPANAEAQLLTFVEVQERSLRFMATLDYHLQHGELRNLTLSLGHWEGGEVQLQAAQVAHIRTADEVLEVRGPNPAFILRPAALASRSLRTWTLELRPRVTGRYRLTLTGSISLEAGAVSMPDVRVKAAGLMPAHITRRLAVARPDLVVEAPAGLLETDPPRVLQPWPREADRLRRAGGSTWQVQADNWRLRLRPRSTMAGQVPVQLFSSEHTAAVADGQHWVHGAVYRLFHESGADLRLVLPEGAVPVLPVLVDGEEVACLQPGQSRLWLRLPGPAGARTVQLRWTFKADKETLDRPVLEQAQLEGVRESPILWTVHVPTGYRLSMEGRGGTLAPLPATGAGQELRRAAVQLRLLELLGQRARDGGDTSAAGQIWTAQQRFETFCRQAEHQLALPAGGVAEAGPDGQPPAQWLQALRERYRVLARTLDLDKIRTEATHGRTATQTPSAAAAGMEIAASGLPRYWQGAAGASVPRLHLTPTQSRQARQSWLLSGGLVLLLLASWGLAQVAKVKAWPEQLALLGCLGWLVFGAGWGALFLVLTAAGVGVRVAVLLRWGMSWLRQRFPRTAASSP